MDERYLVKTVTKEEWQFMNRNDGAVSETDSTQHCAERAWFQVLREYAYHLRDMKEVGRDSLLPRFYGFFEVSLCQLSTTMHCCFMENVFPKKVNIYIRAVCCLKEIGFSKKLT